MEITEVHIIIKVRMTVVFISACRDLTGSKLVTHPFFKSRQQGIVCIPGLVLTEMLPAQWVTLNDIYIGHF